MIKKTALFLTLALLVTFGLIGGTQAKSDTKVQEKAYTGYPKSSDENKALPADIGRPYAFYLTMSDGKRIACDLWFPEKFDRSDKDAKPLATIMRMTRYAREIHLNDAIKQNPQFMAMAKQFMRDDHFGARYTSNNFAYISIDARGSGASYGSRAHPWTAREIKDYGEIADWISKQDWSNKRIGAVGISYEGNTAEFIAANRHPAVKVVVPMYDEFDVFHQVSHPGGVFNDWFVKNWSAINKALDSNDIGYFSKRFGIPMEQLAMFTTGVKPVDATGGMKLRREAIKEHKENGDVYKLAKSVTYRDDKAASNGSSMDDLSPFSRRIEIEKSGALIYGWASWLDAGTAEGALARLMTYKNKQQVVIGPWAHGGGYNSSPFPNKDQVHEHYKEGQGAMVMAFLKNHLQGTDAEVEKARKAFRNEVRYYVHGADEWRMARQWPPRTHIKSAPEDAENGKVFWNFTANKGMHRSSLGADKAATSTMDYKVNFKASTGTNNRWHTQIGQAVEYTDRRVADRKLLTFTHKLEKGIEIIGSPEVTLSMSVDQEDAAVFVYLEMFDPKTGASTYITEGMLRLMHRKESDPAKAPYKQFGAYHSFTKADSLPVKKNEEIKFKVVLFPTAVRIPAGMAIRVAIGGADADTFARYPAEGDLNFKVKVGTILDSGVHLPMREIEAEKKEPKKEEKKD